MEDMASYTVYENIAIPDPPEKGPVRAILTTSAAIATGENEVAIKKATTERDAFMDILLWV